MNRKAFLAIVAGISIAVVALHVHFDARAISRRRTKVAELVELRTKLLHADVQTVLSTLGPPTTITVKKLVPHPRASAAATEIQLVYEYSFQELPWTEKHSVWMTFRFETDSPRLTAVIVDETFS